MRMLTFCIVTGVSLAATVHAADDTIATTRTTLEKWVETRQMIARTKASWQSDKETLEQTVQLFQKELAGVEEKITNLSTNNTEISKQWAEAEALKKISTGALDQARSFAASFEAKLKAIVPRLPVPLQEDKNLKAFLNRIPADPANTRMSAAERAQVIVGILNELDKFNTAVTVFSEKRKNSQGAEVAVETVYIGLGAAYFVNEAGDFAGMGTVGADGWEWTTKPELATSVREILLAYRNERPARFVPLPAVIR